MKGTRFEFGDVGIFHALNELENCDMSLGDEFDLEWAERQFEEDLNVPDMLAPGNKIKTRSYFTEEGMTAFKEAIDILYNLFVTYMEDAGLGEISEITEEIPDDLIVYKDDYQFLIAYDTDNEEK